MARDNARSLRRKKVDRQLAAGAIERRPPTAAEAAALMDAVRRGRFQELGVGRLAPLDVNAPVVQARGGGSVTLLEFACAGDGDGSGWTPKPQAVQALLRAGALPSVAVPSSAAALAAVHYPPTKLFVTVAAARMRRRAAASPLEESSPCERCGGARELACERCGGTHHPPGFPEPPHAVRAASLARFLALPASRAGLSVADVKALASAPKPGALPLPDAAALLPGLFRDSRLDSLREAAARGCAFRLAALVEAGVDVDGADDAGVTALMLAAWRGRSAAVRLLLAAGADPALVAAGGGTARSAARTAGHPECDALLAGAGAPEPPPPRPLAPAAAPAAVRVTPLAAWVPDKYAVNGTGAAVVDGAIPPAELAWLEELARAQAGRFAKRARQTADAGRLSQALNTDAERAHLFDLDGRIRAAVAQALAAAPEARSITGCTRALPGFRFLRYRGAGDSLAEHEDLAKRDPEAEPGAAHGCMSTHTLIVYLSGGAGADEGGETVLLRRFTPPGGVPQPLSECRPVRGRMLLFPHACPHLARAVLAPPKVILRGECLA
eukprot:jgi/Tetstr1/458944/TSEL_004415.t1